MIWNVFDGKENWLGTIHGSNELDALENAKQNGMIEAVRVEPSEGRAA